MTSSGIAEESSNFFAHKPSSFASYDLRRTSNESPSAVSCQSRHNDFGSDRNRLSSASGLNYTYRVSRVIDANARAAFGTYSDSAAQWQGPDRRRHAAQSGFLQIRRTL